MVPKASGDARRGFAFYNYHSAPISRGGIETLVKFVTAQFSITLLRFFFCCDVRSTPADIVDLVATIQNCEVVHMRNESAAGLEAGISQRILKLTSSVEPGLVVLIADDGEYSLLFDGLHHEWELSIIYPSGGRSSFHELADSAFQLPFGLARQIEVEKSGSCSSESCGQKLRAICELNKSLLAVLQKIRKANENEEDLGKDEEDRKEEEEEKPRGNGWDSFPELNPDKLLTVCEWDEVDKEMEVERTSMRGPGAGLNPFGGPESKNPFGGGGGGADPLSAGIAPPPALVAPSNTMSYNQNPYDNYDAISTFISGQPYVFISSHGQPPSVPRFGPAWKRGETTPTRRNPFAGGAAGGPVNHEAFSKPAPQCPQWEDREHRAAGSCNLWHPHKECMFYPMCRILAVDCGYAHPFCTDGDCQCGPARDPQLNHFFAEE